jgi:RNA polymerase sigma-70 factor (ECF subfamily)
MNGMPACEIDEQWRECYRELAPKLLLYARQWLPEVSDAEDAVQTAFVRFWKQHPDASREDYALAFTAVRTVALDLIRSRKRRASREDLLAAGESGTGAPVFFDVSLEQREEAERVQVALRELPAEQREVVVLRLWGGLSFAEVARTTGQPLNTVTSRYRYAIDRLRKFFEYEHRTV